MRNAPAPQSLPARVVSVSYLNGEPPPTFDAGGLHAHDSLSHFAHHSDTLICAVTSLTSPSRCRARDFMSWRIKLSCLSVFFVIWIPIRPAVADLPEGAGAPVPAEEIDLEALVRESETLVGLRKEGERWIHKVDAPAPIWYVKVKMINGSTVPDLIFEAAVKEIENHAQSGDVDHDR